MLLLLLLLLPLMTLSFEDKDRLHRFAVNMAEVLNDKFNVESRFNEFKEAFAETKYVQYKQEGRLSAITSVETLLADFNRVVIELAQKAEESFYTTPPDPNTTFYDGDLHFNTVRGDDWVLDDKKDLQLSEIPDQRFGLRINRDSSVVRVAVDMFIGDRRVKHDIRMTSRLDQTFKRNSNVTKDFYFQHFGTPNGVTRVYPAHYFSQFKYTTRGTKEYYDGRDRVWYIEGTSPPKDLLFMVDFSGSMDGLAQTIAKNLLKLLFLHTPNYDYINVVVINKDPFMPSSCFNSTLEKATKELKQHLLESLEDVEVFGSSNFSKALNLAFDVFERSDRVDKTNGCSKTLVLLSDGDVLGYEEIFRERNKKFGDKPVKVLVFRTESTMERNDLLSKRDDGGVLSLACGNGGDYVHLSDNSEIFSVLVNYTDFFVPESQKYNADSGITEIAPKWTHIYDSFVNVGPTATLVKPVVVTADYNYYKYNNLSKSGRQIAQEEQARVKQEANSTTKLLGVAGVDFPIFKNFGKDNILSNFARVITMREEYLISHPDLKSVDRLFEYQQIERGPNVGKIKQIQASHAMGQDKFLRLPLFLSSTHTPVGREIPVDTFYKIKPVRNSPFTVGLSIPIRLDYQYQFSSLDEIDMGRTSLEAYEKNIIFRSLENSGCPSVLEYLGQDENRNALEDMILSQLRKMQSSDTIPQPLLCLYDLYLPSLMEGAALSKILKDWNKHTNPDSSKTFFHSSSGNIYVSPRRDNQAESISDLQEEGMFAKMATSDPMDILYVSLGRRSRDLDLFDINPYFNLSKRVPLPTKEDQRGELEHKAAGILSTQVTGEALTNTIWGPTLSRALNSPEKVVYVLDEYGYVVFILTQHSYEIQLKTVDEFLQLRDINNPYLNVTSRNRNVFFGEIQPLLMRALVDKGFYRQHVLDRCKERCMKDQPYHTMPDITDSAPFFSNILLSSFLFVNQILLNILRASLLSITTWFTASSLDMKHYEVVRTTYSCCSAHYLYMNDFSAKAPVSFYCKARSSQESRCISKSILVQPVPHTNLLFVQDTDKSTYCVNLEGSLCPALSTITPFNNVDHTLQSNLTLCNFNYTIADRRRSNVCYQRNFHECSSATQINNYTLVHLVVFLLLLLDKTFIVI